ncbi:hypothetical protein U9M48_039344, partial [Paspalum notatum var. saurae]
MFTSLSGNVEDYDKITFGETPSARYTWVYFLEDKTEVAHVFSKFANRDQNEFNTSIVKIRSDNGREFDNTNIEEYCDEVGIKHEFSATYTPQQNGVVERKNRTLIPLARSMLDEYGTIARLEAVRCLLAYATHHDMKLYQMDVKSAFLNGYINELVYVEQPPGFEDPNNPNHVYRLSKALYGLKQAPRAWYERLRDFLIEKGFKIGRVDTTLFTKKMDDDLFVCQVYVDDIIFGSTNEDLCREFGEIMAKEFELSMIGELTFFLGFQIKPLKEGTFIYQEKYTRDLLKRFKMDDCKPIETPMATNTKLDADESGIKVDQTLYESMIGSLLYLCASRPDIMFSVFSCARFQADPKESHLTAVKRIL